MPSPAAHILETALALQRAPGERFRLREKPLPAGLLHVLEIAAASPPALQAAAAEVGESEQDVLEAVRFYLEQVLFATPEADAYRVLGLAQDATPEAIRTHHRWLQRWLHPDRAQAGDASIFATRVNQAFAQLRSPELRHAYDVRVAEARMAGASAPLAAETVRHWGHDENEAPRYGRRSRWLLMAALAACVVLAVLIMRNPDRSAEWSPAEGEPGVVEHEDPGPAIEDGDLGVLSAALAITPQAAGEPEPAGTAPATGDAGGVETLPAPRAATSTPVRQPVKGLRALVASALGSLRDREAAGADVVAKASTVAALPKRIEETAAMPRQTVLAAAAPPASPEPPAAPPQPAPAPSAPVQPTSNSPVIAADAALVATRLPLAEQRVNQVAGYLTARPGAVPLWDNVHAMAETDQVRQRLNARKGSRIELGRPTWRMRPEQASLSADYRCRADDGTPCNGRLEVTLVWREGLWLVRGVALGPSA